MSFGDPIDRFHLRLQYLHGSISTPAAWTGIEQNFQGRRFFVTITAIVSCFSL
jgi:hypothetical protein